MMPDIYLGFNFIHGLEAKTMKTILNERHRFGFFSGFRDFVQRVPISLEQLMILIRSESFKFTQQNKKELLWDAHFLLNKKKKKPTTLPLFQTKAKKFTLPTLWKHELEDAFDEIEFFGFPISISPFKLATHIPSSPITAEMLPKYVNKNITLVGYLIHVKSIQTKNKKNMFFGTFLDLKNQWIDTVSFPNAAVQYPFTGSGSYLLHGKVVEEFDYYSLEIIWQKRIPNKNIQEEENTRIKVGRSSKTLIN